MPNFHIGYYNYTKLGRYILCFTLLQYVEILTYELWFMKNIYVISIPL